MAKHDENPADGRSASNCELGAWISVNDRLPRKQLLLKNHASGDPLERKVRGDMNLQQALKWADDNAQGEAVDRLRSRKVAKLLANTVRSYEAWIREEGERNNTCTYTVLGKVCGYCECKRKPSNLKLTGRGEPNL